MLIVTQVHGTCLGFEALAVVVSDNATILGKCVAGVIENFPSAWGLLKVVTLGFKGQLPVKPQLCLDILPVTRDSAPVPVWLARVALIARLSFLLALTMTACFPPGSTQRTCPPHCS